jgi:hypothetical protein
MGGGDDSVICWICRFRSASSSFVESNSSRMSAVVSMGTWAATTGGCAAGTGDADRLIVLMLGEDRSRHSLSRNHISFSSDFTSSVPQDCKFWLINKDCSINPSNRRLSLLTTCRLRSRSVTVESLILNLSCKSDSFYHQRPAPPGTKSRSPGTNIAKENARVCIWG